MSDPRRPGLNDVTPVDDVVTVDEAREARFTMDSLVYELPDAIARAKLAELAMKRIKGDLYRRSTETSHERRMLDVESHVHFKLATEAAVEAKRRADEAQLRFDVAKIKISLHQTIRRTNSERDALEYSRQRDTFDRERRER